MRTLTITLCLIATPAIADVAGTAWVIDGDTIERAYYKITDPQIRKRLYELTKAVGAADA